MKRALPVVRPPTFKDRVVAAAKALGFPISTTFSASDPMLSALLSVNYSSAGITINEESALQEPTVWACCRVLAETIGSLPVCVYTRDDDGDFVEVPDHPVAALFNQPNNLMTSVEFREAKATNLCLWGNGYSIKEDVRSDGSVVSLMPVASSLVNPKQLENGGVAYEIKDRGKIIRLPQEKVWHVKGFGSSGLVGYSPLGYARQVFGTALATEQFQAKFFANGAMPSFFVKIGKWLQQNERQKALENLNALMGGLENAYRIQLIEGGMEVEPAMMPLDDAQFMQLKGMSAKDICRVYRMQPHMVGILDDATNNNIEHQSLEFVMYTLAPWLTRLEASANRWLMPTADRNRCFLRFDVDALLRADAQARAELHSKYVQNGIMSRNEVRKIEKLERSADPAMDAFTVQVNLTPIDQLASVAAAIGAAKKVSAPAPSNEGGT